MKGLKIRIADTKAILLKLRVRPRVMLHVLQHANWIAVPTSNRQICGHRAVVKLIEIPHEIMGDGTSRAVLVD